MPQNRDKKVLRLPRTLDEMSSLNRADRVVLVYEEKPKSIERLNFVVMAWSWNYSSKILNLKILKFPKS